MLQLFDFCSIYYDYSVQLRHCISCRRITFSLLIQTVASIVSAMLLVHMATSVIQFLDNVAVGMVWLVDDVIHARIHMLKLLFEVVKVKHFLSWLTYLFFFNSWSVFHLNCFLLFIGSCVWWLSSQLFAWLVVGADTIWKDCTRIMPEPLTGQGIKSMWWNTGWLAGTRSIQLYIWSFPRSA
jgi:hypothetical protein